MLEKMPYEVVPKSKGVVASGKGGRVKVKEGISGEACAQVVDGEDDRLGEGGELRVEEGDDDGIDFCWV